MSNAVNVTVNGMKTTPELTVVIVFPEMSTIFVVAVIITSLIFIIGSCVFICNSPQKWNDGETKHFERISIYESDDDEEYGDEMSCYHAVVDDSPLGTARLRSYPQNYPSMR